MEEHGEYHARLLAKEKLLTLPQKQFLITNS